MVSTEICNIILQEITMKKLMFQILRFGVVGGSAFLIDYALLFVLTEFGEINYLLSSCISFIVSVIYNYILSVIWVFDVGEERKAVHSFFIFIILSIIGLGINALIMWCMVDRLSVYYMLAKIVATAVVMVYNFVTRKLFLEAG